MIVAKTLGLNLKGGSICQNYLVTVESIKSITKELETKLRSAPNCPQIATSIYTQIRESPIFKTAVTPISLDFLSARLSQFKKATRIFATRQHDSTALANDFHRACDRVPNTLVIVKSGNYFAGGFTDTAWASPVDSWNYAKPPEHFYSAYAFLFSINREKIYSIAFRNNAIYSGWDIGFSFGTDGNGLSVKPDFGGSNGGVSRLTSYDVDLADDRETELMGSPTFKVDQYEVWRLE